MTKYSDLVNKNGTIYNTKTGKGYSNRADLATDLGSDIASIKWNQIKTDSNYNYNPSTPTTPTTPSTPAANQPGPPDTGTKKVDTGTNPAAAPTGVAFIDSEAYKRLTPDQQAIVNTMYNVYSTGTNQQQSLLVDAIKKAVATADPYYKSLLDITIGEFGAKVAAENNDFATQSKIIKQTQSNLLANVNAQEGALTLENQADLSKIAINYNNDILDTQNTAANKGVVEGEGYGTLDYSTKLLTAQKENTIMSTNAAFNYSIKALELQASQGDTNAQLKLQQLQQQHAGSIGEIGGSAEKTLGTSNASNVPGLTDAGYAPKGNGFIGSIEQAKQSDILTGIKGYLGLNQPAL